MTNKTNATHVETSTAFPPSVFVAAPGQTATVSPLSQAAHQHSGINPDSQGGLFALSEYPTCGGSFRRVLA